MIMGTETDTDHDSKIVLRQFETGENTTLLVRELVSNKGNWRQTIEAIKKSPSTALKAIGNIDTAKTGLSLRTQSDAVEIVLETVGDDKLAGELLSNHLSAERAGQLIAARGDLPSSGHLIAHIDVIVYAIRDVLKNAPDGGILVLQAQELFHKLENEEATNDSEHLALDGAEDDSDDDDVTGAAPSFDDAGNVIEPQEQVTAVEPERSFETHQHAFIRSFTRDAVLAVYGFVRNLRERPDFEDLLDIQLIKGAPIRWYVGLAVWVESCWPKSPDDMDTASFVELGLEPLDMLALVQQLSNGEPPHSNGTSLERYLGNRAVTKGSAPSATEAARASTKQKATNLL